MRSGWLAIAALLSGAGALVFETLWFHQAALAVGNSVWAASLVLAAFMAGMGLGNALAARHGERVRRALQGYAALEIVVALTGVALVYALPEFGLTFARLGGALGDRPVLLSTLRFGCAFGWLLLPSLAMGLTLPLLVRAASPWDGNFGRVLGVLYGANTLGAVLGAALSESVLIRYLGIRGSAQLAACANVSAALIAFLLARTSAPPMAAAPRPAIDRAELPLLAASFLAGGLLLCLEVIWLRLLMLFLNDTPLAFSLVLALVLAGIAIGSFAASLWSSMSARAADQAHLVAYAAGLVGFAGYLAYPIVLRGSFPPYQSAATVLSVGAPLVMPTSIASGALFTLLGSAIRRTAAADSVATGRLGFANTAGAGLGSLLGGFVLLPRLGMELALLGTLAAYGLIGCMLAWRAPVRRVLRYASVVCFATALAFFPFGTVRDQFVRASASRWTRGTGGEAELASVREGLTATLMHVVHRRHGVPVFDQVATNAYTMSGNSHFGRRYMKLFVYLPLALHPRIERALIVGYGVGNTAEALTDSAELKQIDIVDVSRDMLEVSRTLQVANTRSPLDDPRVHVRIEDGRFYLQSTGVRYDLITGEPPPPIMAGVVHLYTTEYFELIHSRLAPGGIATYWLPVINISASTTKSLIGAFCAAFADCSLWHGAAHNLMLMGSRDARGPVSDARFSRQWRDAGVRAELASLGLELPAQLGALFIGDAPYLRQLSADTAPLTDDWPARLQQPQDKARRDQLLNLFRDEAAARVRFAQSKTVATLLPASARRDAWNQFDVQWLINELSFPKPTIPHDTQLLHRVLRGTELRWPVLLLLDSDPDVQRAMARLPRDVRERPEWMAHRVAGLLADRQYEPALALLDRLSPADQPMPGLYEYVQEMVERMETHYAIQ